MKRKNKRSKEKSLRISCIGIISDTLISRGGLSLFVRSIDGIGIMSHMHWLFGGIRKSRKGRCVQELFKQVLCYFINGTSRYLVYFDCMKENAGYGMRPRMT